MLIRKITDGYVIQTFDTDTHKCIKQEFVARNDGSELIDANDVNLSSYIKELTDADNLYHPFEMKQPKKGK